MMVWFNKYALVFMCDLRKPHPFGNERNPICCGLTSIFWRSQIVKGKDCHKLISKKKYNELWEKLSLMLWMCRPIFG